MKRSTLLPASLGLALTGLLFAASAHANVTAPYLACDGKDENEQCRYFGGLYGTCLLDTLCTLPPDDEGANRCIVCGDPCRHSDPGEACTTDENRPGTCGLRMGCEDDPEKSYNTCMYCFPEGTGPGGSGGGAGGSGGGDGDDSGSCALITGGVAIPWMLLLAAGGLQLRRRRPTRIHR